MELGEQGEQHEEEDAEEERDANKSPLKKKKLTKAQEKREKCNKLKERLKIAVNGFLEGKFANMRQAALHYGVNYSTLYKGLSKDGGEFKGRGQFSSWLSEEEELKIVGHVKWWQEIGYGLDWKGLQCLLQEIFIMVTKSNPARVTGLESCGHLPDLAWVRHFAEQHILVLCTTMASSKGRQVISEEELGLWQGDIFSLINAKPELLQALKVIWCLDLLPLDWSLILSITLLTFDSF